jgi:hypothetical protein
MKPISNTSKYNLHCRQLDDDLVMQIYHASLYPTPNIPCVEIDYFYFES